MQDLTPVHVLERHRTRRRNVVLYLVAKPRFVEAAWKMREGNTVPADAECPGM